MSEPNPLLADIESAFSAPAPDRRPDRSPEENAFRLKSGMFDDPGEAVRAGMSARLPFADVSAGFRAGTGQDLPGHVEQSYTQDLKLAQARDKYAGAQESDYGFLLRRAVPFGSAIGGLRREVQYKDAVDRIRAGKPEEDDYEKVAQYERLREIDRERGIGRSVAAGVAHVPALLGEGAVAGRALTAGARALGLGGRAIAPAAGELAAQSLGQRAATVAARSPFLTAAMPAMYLQEAGRRAATQGGEWTDARNIVPAFAMGVAQTATLGTLQRFVTEGSVLKQIAGKTALGMTEQAAVDVGAQAISDAVLNKNWKLDTGYGLVGDLLKSARGRENEGLKHALTQAAVFGTFSAFHVAQQRRHKGEPADLESAVSKAAEFTADVAARAKEMKDKGYPAEWVDKAAGEYARKVQTVSENPTKEAAQELLKADPDHPFNPALEKMAEALPDAETETRLLAASMGIDAARPIEQVRRDIALRQDPERFAASQTPIAALEGRRPEQLPKSSSPPPEPTPAPKTEPARPLADWADADVVSAVRTMGWKPKKGAETRKAAEKWIATQPGLAETLARFKPPEAAKAPETPTPPETAPESPQASAPPEPAPTGGEPAVRPAGEAVEATDPAKTSGAIRREALFRRLRSPAPEPEVDPRTTVLSGVLDKAGLSGRATGGPVSDAFYRKIPVGEGEGKREIDFQYNPDTSTLSIDFSNLDFKTQSLVDVPANIRSGSMDIARTLRAVAASAREAGLAVEYAAEANRHRLYARNLELAGYELASAEKLKPDSPFSAYRWTPTGTPGKVGQKVQRERTPEQAARIAAYEARVKAQSEAPRPKGPPKPPPPSDTARAVRIAEARKKAGTKAQAPEAKALSVEEARALIRTLPPEIYNLRDHIEHAEAASKAVRESGRKPGPAVAAGIEMLPQLRKRLAEAEAELEAAHKVAAPKAPEPKPADELLPDVDATPETNAETLAAIVEKSQARGPSIRERLEQARADLLTPKQRDTVQKLLDGETHEAIAKKRGVTKAAVISLEKKALELLEATETVAQERQRLDDARLVKAQEEGGKNQGEVTKVEETAEQIVTRRSEALLNQYGRRLDLAPVQKVFEEIQAAQLRAAAKNKAPTARQWEEWNQRLTRAVATADKRAESKLKAQAESNGPENDLRAWVRSEGGLSVKDVVEHFGKEWQKDEPWLIHLVNPKGKGRKTTGVDVLGRMAEEAGFIRADPTRGADGLLMEALQRGDKIGRAAEADAERQMADRDRREFEQWAEREREAGRDPNRPAEVDNEEIPFSPGNAAPPEQLPKSSSSPQAEPVTPSTIIAEQNAIFGRAHGARDYRGEKRLSGGAEAKADLRAGNTQTTKRAAQDPWANLEENAHHLSFRGGLETNPHELPARVVKGFEALNRRFGRGYPYGPTAIVEGYASWVKLRAADQLKDLSRNERAAADFAERFSKAHDYLPMLDKVGELYANWRSQTAEQRAAGYTSATGRPAEADATAAEVRQKLADQFADQFDNDLGVLTRMEADIDAARKREGRPALKPDEKVSTLAAGIRASGQAVAGLMEKNGVRVWNPKDKTWTTLPQTAMDHILEGAKPEWIDDGPNGAASRAGTYAANRHVVNEYDRAVAARTAVNRARQLAEAAHERAVGEEMKRTTAEILAQVRDTARRVFKDTEVRMNLVPEAELKARRAALAEARADREFGPWAERFADRLSNAFDATQALYESVGLTRPGTAAYLKEKYPDFVSTERSAAEGWNNLLPGKKGEKEARLISSRSGSGEAIIDPLLSYKRRLLVAASAVQTHMVRAKLYDLAHQPGAGPYLAIYDRGVERTARGKAQAEVLKSVGVDPENITAVLKGMGLDRAESYFRAEPWPNDPSKATIEVMVDGEPVTLRVGDRALYELATNQQVESHQAARVLQGFANLEIGGVKPVQVQKDIVRTGATGASLAFQAKNVPRDILTYWQNTINRTSGGGPLQAAARLAPEYWRAYGRMARAFADNWREWMWGAGARRNRPEDPFWNQYWDLRADQLRQYAFERDNPEKMYNGIKTAHTRWSLFKDFLGVLGAGEHAPRFREFRDRLVKTTGKSEAQLREEFATAEKQLLEGKPTADPVPYPLVLDALNAAAEVTVPFQRQGTLTRQFNAITPFFGPAVAGLSKAIRQAKADPKRAAVAFGLLGVLRTIHWLAYHDEDWYKELSPHDRYNNFVVDTPVGLRRLPGPRDLNLVIGGTTVAMLDAAQNNHPDFAGLLEQSLEATLPPGVGPGVSDIAKGDVGMGAARLGAFPAGPVGTLGVELTANKDWTGRPIVPKREEDTTSGWDKFVDRYGPYALKQLTGGRGEASTGGLGLNVAPEVKALNRSVDELYDRYHELEVEKARATRAGRKFAEEAEFNRLDAARRQIAELRSQARGERTVAGRKVEGEKPDDARRAELTGRAAAIARRALGR